jgi:putative endonuclease
MNTHVYILRCADDSYYVGNTRSSLEERIGQHNAGHFGGYTKTRRPVVLVWSQDFDRITDAVAAERQIKGWSRAKKEALIAGDYDLLHELARYRRRVSRPDPSTRARGAAQDEDGRA